MRSHYMQSLVRRTADQEDLKFCARQNIQYLRMEKEESRLRQEDKALELLSRDAKVAKRWAKRR